MSDLISRSTAMENYCNALCPKLQKGEYCNNCIVKAWLNNQPAAYDTDKVVAQLEEYGNEEMDYYRNTPYEKCIEECVHKAIDIVKGGGVDAKTDS